jgi:hypothetical protein
MKELNMYIFFKSQILFSNRKTKSQKIKGEQLEILAATLFLLTRLD